MPNIGFMELLLISIVALLVLGPEKLPQAVRTAALWVGRARRSFNKIRAEIEREINADEIRRQLHNESILADLDEAKEKASQLTRDTKDSFSKLEKDVRHGLDGEKEEDGSAGEEEKPGESQPGDSPVTGRKAAETATPDAATHEADTDGENRSETDDSVAGDGEDRQAERSGEAAEKKPVTDFYNNPPDKVTVQGRKFKAGTDDDDRA